MSVGLAAREGMRGVRDLLRSVKRGSAMTAYRHIIFRITIVAFLAAFLTFIPGCGKSEDDSPSVESSGDEENKDSGAPVKSELQIVYSQRETNNPNWLPPVGHTVQTSEGWDKETGCAVEIEHEKSGIVLRLVPAGEFDMGALSAEEPWHRHGEGERRKLYKDDYPLHRVKISEPLYIGKYEVTQEQWKAVMGNNPSGFKGDNLPVEQVSWDDVQEFCRKADDGLRLPSEAEWEYACRAGSTTKWCFGDNEDTLDEYAWYYENSGKKTHEAGTRKPNAWGLYDMHGNVWEWCEDVWHESYDGADRPDDGSAWTSGGEQSRRVGRGCSWGDGARVTRSAYRIGGEPDDRGNRLGFRVVVDAEAVR